MIKRLLTLTCLFLPVLSYADMPYINTSPSESRSRVQDGDKSCESSKAQTTLNVGVYGNNGSQYMYADQDKGGFVSLSVPIGHSDTLDCSKLYDQLLASKEMDNEQKEIQIQQLKMQLAEMQRNQQLQKNRNLSVN